MEQSKKDITLSKDHPYSVIVEDGKQFLCYEGEKLPFQLSSVVVQNMEHIEHKKVNMCEITITVLALLKDTK